MKLNIINASILLASYSIYANKPVAPAPIAPLEDPNPTARWGTNKRGNIFISGEGLLFKPLQTYVTQQNGQTSTFFTYKYAPGYRISLGYNIPYDRWDSLLTYTSLNYKHNNTYSNAKTTDIPYQYPGAQTIKYYYNQGDLELGRMCKVSKRLKIRPHLGLRALWLRQYNIINSERLSNLSYTYTNTIKNTNNLVGLTGGFDSQWMLAKEYSIYANATLGSLVNSYKFYQTSKNNVNSTLISNISTSNYTATVNFAYDIYMGFRWDKMLDQNRFHVSLNLGYEQHSYININQGTSLPQDFTYQGFAFGGRFDF